MEQQDGNLATPSAIPDGQQRPDRGADCRSRGICRNRGVCDDEVGAYVHGDRESQGAGTQKTETYTFQWEQGSPTLRVATGHTYVVAAELSTIPEQLGSLLNAFAIKDITVTRFSSRSPQQLFLLTFSAGRHPHPDLGEVFLCDEPFLLAHRDVRGRHGF